MFARNDRFRNDVISGFRIKRDDFCRQCQWLRMSLDAIPAEAGFDPLKHRTERLWRVCIIETHILILLRGLIVVCSENHMKYVNTLYRHNEKHFFEVLK
jgi:hypothetical protein